MKFDIAARFNWCTVFDGALNSPMRCELGLADGYYLIYIAMPDGADAGELDILKLLNKAFGTSFTEGLLLVENAGFFTFSGDGARTLQQVFPDAPLPASVRQASQSMLGSTSFWLTIRIKSDLLFNSLIEVGYKDGDTPQAEIALSGVLNNTKTAGKAMTDGVFNASLPTIQLLNLFTFSKLQLQYSFGAQKQYAIQGNIDVELFKHEYTFAGRVVSNATVLTACLMSLDAAEKLDQPFDGAMRGIVLDNLLFGLRYTFSTPQQPGSGIYWVQGHVTYGQLSLSGQICLQGTTPLLGFVSIDQPLSIGTLFNQSIKGYTWPTDLIDISCEAGSQIYYRPATGTLPRLGDFSCPVGGGQQLSLAAPAQAIDYQPGFHLHARFDLTLLDTITVIGDLQIADDGVTARIQLAQPISLYVLRITGPKTSSPMAADTGPILTLSTVGGSSMGFSCGLRFFQADFGVEVDITARKSAGGDLRIAGALSGDSAIQPFFSQLPRLQFSYSKDEGFHVTGWNAFDMLSDAIDFIKELKKLAAAGSGGCGALGDFINAKLLSSTFQISPAFATTDQSLSLVLNGTCTLAVAGNNFATLQFPKIVAVPLPGDPSFDSLLGDIGTALAGAAESFVKGLMNNSEAIGTFLAVMAGQQAASYALTLACQGLIDAAATAAAEAAAGVIAAAGGALTAAIVGAAVAAGGAAASSSGGHGGGGGGQGPKNPDTPQNVVAGFANGVFSVGWSVTQNANRYQVEMQGPSGVAPQSAQSDFRTQTVSFQVQSEPPAGIYSFSVKAGRDAYLSAPANTRLSLLAAPALQVSLSSAEQARAATVLLSWAEIPGAVKYGLQLAHDGQTQPLPDVAAPALSGSHQFGPGDAAGEYAFAARALHGAGAIDSAWSQAQSWTRLAEPTQVAASWDGTGFVVGWNAGDHARILLSLFDPAGALAYQHIATAGTRSATMVPDFPLLPGAYQWYAASLPGTDATREIPSLWNAAAPLDLMLTAPQLAAQVFTLKMAGDSCGALLLRAFPTLLAEALAAAMAHAGYAADASAHGLKAAYPGAAMDAAAMAAALHAAYAPMPPDAPAMAAILIEAFHDASGGNAITAPGMAAALAGALYSATQVAPTLKHYYFNQAGTAATLAVLLRDAYASQGIALGGMLDALAAASFNAAVIAPVGRAMYAAAATPAALGAGLVAALAATAPLTALQLGVALHAAGFRDADLQTGIMAGLSATTAGLLAALSSVIADPATSATLASAAALQHDGDTMAGAARKVADATGVNAKVLAAALGSTFTPPNPDLAALVRALVAGYAAPAPDIVAQGCLAFFPDSSGAGLLTAMTAAFADAGQPLTAQAACAAVATAFDFIGAPLTQAAYGAMFVAAAGQAATPSALAAALVQVYGAAATPASLTAALAGAFSGGATLVDARVAAAAVTTALGLKPNDAGVLAEPLAATFGLTRCPNDVAALTVALRHAAFTLNATSAALSGYFGAAWSGAAFRMVGSVYTRPAWTVALAQRDGGMPITTAAPAVYAVHADTDAVLMVQILAATYDLTHTQAALQAMAAALKAVRSNGAPAYSLSAASAAMSAQYAPDWSATDWRRFITYYNS